MLRLRVGEEALKQGWSKSGLQRASGVTMPTLLKYWDNEVEKVHLPSLERLARALKVPAASLLDERPDKAEEKEQESVKA